MISPKGKRSQSKNIAHVGMYNRIVIMAQRHGKRFAGGFKAHKPQGPEAHFGLGQGKASAEVNVTQIDHDNELLNRFDISGLTEIELNSILQYAPPNELHSLLAMVDRPRKKRKHSQVHADDVFQKKRKKKSSGSAPDATQRPTESKSRVEPDPQLVFSVAQGHVDFFVQRHPFNADPVAKHTVSERRAYTREVYDLARRYGLGSSEASKMLKQVRQTYRKKRRLAKVMAWVDAAMHEGLTMNDALLQVKEQQGWDAATMDGDLKDDSGTDFGTEIDDSNSVLNGTTIRAVDTSNASSKKRRKEDLIRDGRRLKKSKKGFDHGEDAFECGNEGDTSPKSRMKEKRNKGQKNKKKREKKGVDPILSRGSSTDSMQQKVVSLVPSQHLSHGPTFTQEDIGHHRDLAQQGRPERLADPRRPKHSKHRVIGEAVTTRSQQDNTYSSEQADAQVFEKFSSSAHSNDSTQVKENTSVPPEKPSMQTTLIEREQRLQSRTERAVGNTTEDAARFISVAQNSEAREHRFKSHLARSDAGRGQVEVLLPLRNEPSGRSVSGKPKDVPPTPVIVLSEPEDQHIIVEVTDQQRTKNSLEPAARPVREERVSSPAKFRGRSTSGGPGQADLQSPRLRQLNDHGHESNHSSLTRAASHLSEDPNTPVHIQTTADHSEVRPSPLKVSTSPYFVPDSASQESVIRRMSNRSTSCIPFPPLSQARFGLVQETLTKSPFQLLVAVTFLNRTRGLHAIPAFYNLIRSYPTPEVLAEADEAGLAEKFRHLGLQNIRAKRYTQLAKSWIKDPPAKGRRHRKLNYPFTGDGKDIKVREILTDEDPRIGAWEIAHLPTSGPYAIDSWRIFCRDEFRGLATGWNGEDASSVNFEPEWKRVLPQDKELRAFLRWMWLKNGIQWDPLSGQKFKASEKLMNKAREGGLIFDNDFLKYDPDSLRARD